MSLQRCSNNNVNEIFIKLKQLKIIVKLYVTCYVYTFSFQNVKRIELVLYETSPESISITEYLVEL